MCVCVTYGMAIRDVSGADPKRMCDEVTYSMMVMASFVPASK